MNKTVVIYSSIYGHTKRYAEWIAGELNADIFELKKFNAENFNEYDTVIFGAGLYAGNIAVKNMIVKNFEQIKDKKIAIFTVGLADVSKEENISNIKKRILEEFGEKIFNKIRIFHLRGAMDYSKLNFVHRQMMNMVKLMTGRKNKEFTEEEKDFMETFGKTVDFSDKNSILPLVEFVKEDKGEK